MFHLAAYEATNANATLTDIPAILDGIIAIQNNHFLPQEPLQLVAAYAGSANMTEAQLNSPKIRQITPTDIRPFNGALLPPNNYNWFFPYGNTLKVNGQEELQFLSSTSVGGGGEVQYGLIWLQDQPMPMPTGDVYNCIFTSTSTATAKSWTKVSYTLTTLLPAGKYCMVWSELISTSGIGHRWTFDNQYFRPGFVSTASLTNRHPYEIYEGALGAMGYFYTYSLPRLEVLCNAADTSYTGFFQVVRVGDNAAIGSLGTMGMKG